MMNVTRISKTCEVSQANHKNSVSAEVHEFKEHERLVVVLDKSVKLNMTWNGKLYEAKMAGLEFVSNGPTVTKNRTGKNNA